MYSTVINLTLYIIQAYIRTNSLPINIKIARSVGDEAFPSTWRFCSSHLLYLLDDISSRGGDKRKCCIAFTPVRGINYYLALINRAGGLNGRILTEVVSTNRTQ